MTLTHSHPAPSSNPRETLHDMIDALSTAQGFLCLTLRDPSLSRQARDDLEAASRYLQEAIAGTQALSDTLRGE